jgi:threonyl-tRNA synthetase
MPERFELSYTGADNREHRPVMIHRALFGSYERFIGIMLEHFAGELPLWLAPVQAIVLPVSDLFNEYAAEVCDELRAGGARAELDDRSESVSRKIRDAELRKVPYMLVVGERERRGAVVSVREHHGADAGSMSVEEFGQRLRGQLYSPALNSRPLPERDE